MRWDIADFDNYLKSSGASDKCPFCPNSTWDVITRSPGKTDLDVLTISTELLNGDGQKSKESFDAMPFVCSNCGFVRLVAFHTLKDWKKKQAKELVKEQDVI